MYACVSLYSCVHKTLSAIVKKKYKTCRDLSRNVPDLWHVYRNLMGNIKYILEEKKYIPHALKGRLSIVKMSILPQLLHKFNEIEVKIPKRCLGAGLGS
jgi:hypothetical protein